MNTSAIVMLILTILLVWGGLVAAIISLRSRPTPPSSEVHRDL